MIFTLLFFLIKMVFQLFRIFLLMFVKEEWFLFHKRTCGKRILVVMTLSRAFSMKILKSFERRPSTSISIVGRKEGKLGKIQGKSSLSSVDLTQNTFLSSTIRYFLGMFILKLILHVSLLVFSARLLINIFFFKVYILLKDKYSCNN